MNEDVCATVVGAIRAVAPEADVEHLAPDAELQDELDLDSMDFLNVVTELTERLGVDIPERDYDQLRTLHGAVDYLEGRKAVKT